MKITNDPADAQSVLLCGNGRYAHQLFKSLVIERGWQAISLVTDSSIMTPAETFLMREAIFKPRRAISLMKDCQLKRVVLAGDLGGIRADLRTYRTALFADLTGNIPFVGRVLLRMLASRFREVPIVLLLHLISDMLLEAGIQPTIASAVLPSLRPPCGPINSVAQQVFDETRVREIVETAFPDIQSQPRRFVRQAVVVEGRNVIAKEEENTRNLLDAVERVPRGRGPRALVKLAPANVLATIDAPVIGADTISQATKAGVSLIVVDCRNGILAQREDAISLADRAGIALFGYDVSGR